MNEFLDRLIYWLGESGIRVAVSRGVGYRRYRFYRSDRIRDYFDVGAGQDVVTLNKRCAEAFARGVFEARRETK